MAGTVVFQSEGNTFLPGRNGTATCNLLVCINGNLHEMVWKYANYYQSIVYLAGAFIVIASFGAWYQKKELPAALWMPLISVIGGFLFSILWEAQCRYVFPYYVFLILYAPMGLYAVGRMIGGLWNLHKGNRIRNQADTDEELREIA